jgi:C1A family cysteine protease
MKAIILSIVCLGVLYLGMSHLSSSQAQGMWKLRAASNAEIEEAFKEFTLKYRKFYFNQEEMDLRYYIFEKNYKKVKQHNSENKSWTMVINKFSDLTREELNQYYGLKVGPRNGDLHINNYGSKDIDWVAQGKVAPVKDQAQCGSCWAFSAVGAVESLYAISKSTTPVQFSEQQVVDCDTSSAGCEGCWMDNAFEYLIEAGVIKETDYPYVGYDENCEAAGKPIFYHFSGYKDVASSDCSALLDALQKQPISVAVDAENWSYYGGGIMTADECGTSLDHGVLLVGAGTQSGTPYWRIKNSWSASWGEQGFIRLQRDVTNGAGTCGICSSPSYPTA